MLERLTLGLPTARRAHVGGLAHFYGDEAGQWHLHDDFVRCYLPRRMNATDLVVILLHRQLRKFRPVAQQPLLKDLAAQNEESAPFGARQYTKDTHT